MVLPGLIVRCSHSFYISFFNLHAIKSESKFVPKSCCFVLSAVSYAAVLYLVRVVNAVSYIADNIYKHYSQITCK